MHFVKIIHYGRILTKLCQSVLGVRFLKHSVCIPVSETASKQHNAFRCQSSTGDWPFYWLSTYSRRAFCIASPMMWNSPRKHLRDLPHITASFIRLLKSLLYWEYYCSQRIGSCRWCAIRVVVLCNIMLDHGLFTGSEWSFSPNTLHFEVCPETTVVIFRFGSLGFK